MARIRTIKPEFFTDSKITKLKPLARILYVGLWCEADREGRLKWDPLTWKIKILPLDSCNHDELAESLVAAGLLRRYEVNGKDLVCIPSFLEHQHINQREAPSKLAGPSGENMVVHVHAHGKTGESQKRISSELRDTVLARDGHACKRCSATTPLEVDHIFPVSIGGTNAISNLRTLCSTCNAKRPVAGKSLIDDLATDGLTLDDLPRICPHVLAHGEGKGRELEGKGKRRTPIVPKGDEYSQEFQDLVAAYPKRQGTNPLPRAFKAFNAAIDRGATQTQLLTAAKAYARTEVAGTKFCQQLATWLNGDEWRAIIATETGPASYNSDETQWRLRCTNYAPGKYWNKDQWGPRPGEPGCIVPEHIIKETNADGMDPVFARKIA